MHAIDDLVPIRTQAAVQAVNEQVGERVTGRRDIRSGCHIGPQSLARTRRIKLLGLANGRTVDGEIIERRGGHAICVVPCRSEPGWQATFCRCCRRGHPGRLPSMQVRP